MISDDPRNRDRIPICDYQRRYFSKWALDPEGSFFNTSLIFKLSGELDRQALKRACHLVTEKHEITHAVYSKDGAEQSYGGFGIEDFYSEFEHSDEERVDSILETIVNEPFDLTSGPVCKFCLISCGRETHYFIIRAHHIIADSHAARIFLPDFIRAYNALLAGSGDTGLEGYSYADCVDALHKRNTTERREFAKYFWKSFLDGVPPTVAFPRREDWVDNDHSAESIFFELTGTDAQALRTYSAQHRTTLFIVLSALYGSLLTTYSNQEQVLISYPVNLRPGGYGHVLGCFVNLALEKIVVGSETTLDLLVDELTQQRRESKPHLFYPLSNITREQRIDIEKSYFTVFFGETHLNTKPLSLPGLRVEVLDIPWSREFDRELRLLYDADDPDKIRFRMDFQKRKFDKDVILQFVEDFKALSKRAIDSMRPLRQLSLSTTALPAPGSARRSADT